MTTRGHPQTEVVYHDRAIQVDVNMVSLLQACWERGIETFGSCENAGRGDARIWFADEESSRKFRKLAKGMRVGTVSGDWWPLDFNLHEAEEALGVL